MPKDEVEDINHEEMPNDSLVHVEHPKVLSLEDHTKMEVVKFNPLKEAISAMKKKYSRLTISGNDDKAGYKKVKEAWQDLKNTRIKGDKLRKDLKADYIAIGKAIESTYQDEIEAPLAPLEDKLYKLWKDFDNAAEIARQKEENEKQERLDKRVTELIENGMLFTGSFYTIGENVSMDVVTLKEMSEEDYTGKFLPMVKGVNEKLKEAAEQKRKEEEAERQRIENQRLEQEKKEKELKEREDALRKQEEAIQEAKKQELAKRTTGRVKALEGLNMRYDYNETMWEYNNASGNVSISQESVEQMEEKDWDEKINTASLEIKDLINKQFQLDQARIAKEKAETEKRHRTELRIQQLKDKFGVESFEDQLVRTSKFLNISSLKILLSDISDVSNEEWEETLNDITDSYNNIIEEEEILKSKLEEQKEQERLSKLSDIEKANEYLSKLLAIDAPEIESKEIQITLTRVIDFIKESKITI